MNIKDIAPCGIDCINCEVYEPNNRRDIWQMFAERFGVTAEEIACKGCRIQGGCSIHKDCETLDCIKAKKLDSCGDCSEFPCRKLMPLAANAERVPHNLKVYNLCRIKQIGAEEFLKESSKNREYYFKGKFKIGAGPQL